MVAHVVARLLDQHYGQTFQPSLRRRSPYQTGIDISLVPAAGVH